MNNNELISVIIPIYNVEKYLERCIESVINQTYKNLEIILVDDGSTDNCPKICDEYAKKDKRIKVIHKKNEGVSSARNVGLENSSGEYITFVDSDDTINCDMYACMLNEMIKTNSDICYSDLNFVNDALIKRSESLDDKIMDKKKMLEVLCKYNNELFSVWNKIFKRNIIENIKFDENISIKEDALFFAQVIDNSAKICHVKEFFYNYYYKNEESATNQKNVLKDITSLDAISQMIEILKKNKVNTYLEQECIYIGNYYKYKKIIKEQGIDINLEKYEEKVRYFLNEGILSENIGMRNKLKIIYYIKIYNKFIKK